MLLLVLCIATGCKEDPRIVIRFDAPDLAGSSVNAAVRRDAAVAPEPASAACKTDADCTIEVDGCCDCANGGKQKAVSKRRAPGTPKPPCDSACTMMISTDPSCGRRAACVEGSCALRGEPPDEQKRRVMLPKKATP